MEPLDFGADVSDTSKDIYLSVNPMSNDEKEEANRYDSISDMQSKRKQAIYDIKTGVLDASDFPTIFKKFSELIDKLPDGKFIVRTPADNYSRGLSTKMLKFISTGYVGDALASKSMGEIKKIVSDIAEETLMHIPTNNSHPTRKLQSLMKNGTLDDIINFNLKKKHYDLFDPKWIKGTLQPLILSKIFELRKSEKAIARGELGEGLQIILGNLKSVFYS